MITTEQFTTLIEALQNIGRAVWWLSATVGLFAFLYSWRHR